jgi:hypothetical protein
VYSKKAFLFRAISLLGDFFICPAYLMLIKYNTGQCKWQGFKNFV